jgi:hypothetical protein
MKIDIKNIPTYFINMDEHTDKRKSTESALEILGFKNVTRVPGVGGFGQNIGNTMAHIKAISTALESTGGPFVIFEDDIVIKNPNTIIDIPETADALYLGISKWGLYNGYGHKIISVEQHSKDLYRIYNMLTTHGILYFNRDYAKLIMKSYDFIVSISEPVDKANAEFIKYFEVYGLTDPMVYQEGINEETTNFTLPGDSSADKFSAFCYN